MTEPNDLPSLDVAGNVATITLRRPGVANRLSTEDITTLLSQIDQINESNVRVLRITSVGKHFCSGYNIDQMQSGKESGFETLANALEDCRAVTIAAIQGGVYGGATDLALACDFRIGTRDANLFMPAARLGLHFYQRGMERYVSRLGLNTAKLLFLTARKLNSEEMVSCGFLTAVAEPADQLHIEMDRLTATLIGMAPLPLLGMKKQLNAIARNQFDADEIREQVMKSRLSNDLIEGRNAWQEKRQPTFTGT